MSSDNGGEEKLTVKTLGTKWVNKQQKRGRIRTTSCQGKSTNYVQKLTESLHLMYSQIILIVISFTCVEERQGRERLLKLFSS